jgi:FixJ family two-component response regulator
VVDDDESVGRAVTRLARFLEMDAERFASGIAFLQRLDTTTFAPDCLILDVQMPGLTGPEVQQHLARRQRRCPVVVMTAYSDPEGHVKALALGAVAVLFKPVDERQFMAAVRTALCRPLSPPVDGDARP